MPGADLAVSCSIGQETAPHAKVQNGCALMRGPLIMRSRPIIANKDSSTSGRCFGPTTHRAPYSSEKPFKWRIYRLSSNARSC